MLYNLNRAALVGVRAWGRDASIRFLMNKHGWNRATARRCLTIALQCNVVLF